MKRAIVLLMVMSFLPVQLSAYEVGKFYYRATTKEKVLSLTFDDGPGFYTPQILDLLKAHNAKATFFIEGDQVAAYPDHVRRIQQEGHELANHLYSHRNFRFVKDKPQELFIKELEQTEAAIGKALNQTIFRGRALRMPNGAYGPYNRAWLLPTLKSRGYALVHWSYGSDWTGPFFKNPVEKSAEEYLKNSHPGAILLFHDGGRKREKTLRVLQMILPALAQKGYRFVTTEELLSKAP